MREYAEESLDLRDILSELIEMGRVTDALHAKAIQSHIRKAGDQVTMGGGAQGVIASISCRLSMKMSRHQLVLTEHITARSHVLRQYVLAEDRITPTTKEKI